MMPFYVSSELASPSDAPPSPSATSLSHSGHRRSFLHVSCNCTTPLASETDGVLVLHPDCVGGVDIGVLFDAQECTLWEFTAVFESLLARRRLAVDVSGDWVRLGERGRLPWDLCEGLSPGFPSTGLQDVYNHLHHIPHADSEPPVDGVGRPSKRTMADVLIGLPAVRLTPPASPMPARFAAHSFPHPLLGGRCGVCQGRGYILPEMAQSGSSSVEHLLLQQHTQQQRQLKKRLTDPSPTPTITPALSPSPAAASSAFTAVTEPPLTSVATDATSSEKIGRRLAQAVDDASTQLSANQQFSWISTNEDKSLLQQFMAVAETRPSNSFAGSDGAKFDQGSIDYRDVLHRALFVDERGDLSDKNLLIVGDDDLFSIVAALTGEPRMIVVLEKDPRLVDFINNVSVTHSWNDWLVAFQYDIANALDDTLLAGRSGWFDSRGVASFRHAFDVFICDPPDTLEAYALWLSRATDALRGPSSTMYISTTHIEAGAQKWQVFQRMMIFAGFIISDLRRQFTRYPTSDDDLRELTTIPRLASVKALRSSELSWYSSSFVRLVMVDTDARPLLTGDWQVGELMYTDQDQFPTFTAPILSALWAQQWNDLAVHGLLRPTTTTAPTPQPSSSSASSSTDPPDL
jgi:predicted methyltransferase